MQAAAVGRVKRANPEHTVIIAHIVFKISPFFLCLITVGINVGNGITAETVVPGTGTATMVLCSALSLAAILSVHYFCLDLVLYLVYPVLYTLPFTCTLSARKFASAYLYAVNIVITCHLHTFSIYHLYFYYAITIIYTWSLLYCIYGPITLTKDAHAKLVQMMEN